MKKRFELLGGVLPKAKLWAKLCRLAIIVLVAVIGFSMTACSSSGGGGDDTPKITTVYTAGYYYDNGTGNYVACYWKGTAKTDLHTTNDSSAHAIAVVGGDVYAAGFYDDNGSNYIACYWKNGTKTNLSTDYSEANGIVVIVE